MELITRPRRSGKTTILKQRILDDTPFAHTIILCAGKRFVPIWKTWVQNNHTNPSSVHITTLNEDTYESIRHQCRSHPQNISVYVDNIEYVDPIIWSLRSLFEANCAHVVATVTGELTQ